MEKVAAKKVAGVAGAALMVGTLGVGVAVTAEVIGIQGFDPADAQAAEVVRADGLAAEKPSQVRGVFSYTQAEVTPVDTIARVMGDAPAYLCGAEATGELGTVDVRRISVGGDVEHPYVVVLDDVADDEMVHTVLGCSCAGNPADGRVSVNAEVAGVTVRSLFERAGATEDVNTVVFFSTDGYEVALPLNYVLQRYSLVVSSVNGKPVNNAMGGSNQLWLGSTSARYFARDIASVSFEARQTPPPVPGGKDAGDSYANVPNVSLQTGEVLA